MFDTVLRIPPSARTSWILFPLGVCGMQASFPEVAGVTHRFVRIRGVELHVAQAGSGEPLLLLHGWPQHWYMWRHQIPHLVRRYTVICPDMRGFGWSDARQPATRRKRSSTTSWR